MNTLLVQDPQKVSAKPVWSIDAPSSKKGHVVDRLASDIFVGRERELAELQASLEDTLVGHGRLVLLVGEPGISKTRLASEFATIARERGARVLWGRCWEGEGAPAFWPWVQVVRAYIPHDDPETLAMEMGVGAADIA